MNVLVDTSVWSSVLRRKAPDLTMLAELRRLMHEGRLRIIGPVRQELLSGIRDSDQFERVRVRLAALADTELETNDYEDAARLFNLCCCRGVQGSNTDFLICAVSIRAGLKIFTTDNDFAVFARLLPIELYVFPLRSA